MSGEMNPATSSTYRAPSREKAVGTRKHGATSRVAIGVATAQSAVQAVSEVMLFNNSADVCYIARGADPTATIAGGMPIPPQVPFYIQLDEVDKIAVISAVAAGYLYITKVL